MALPRPFLTGLVLLTLLLLAIFHGSREVWPFELAEWRFYVLLVFFLLITLFNHSLMKSSIGKRPTLFANRYMMGVVLKLILSLVLFITIAINSPDAEKLPFGLAFLVTYLAYNTFASRQMLKLKPADT